MKTQISHAGCMDIGCHVTASVKAGGGGTLHFPEVHFNSQKTTDMLQVLLLPSGHYEVLSPAGSLGSQLNQDVPLKTIQRQDQLVKTSKSPNMSLTRLVPL